MPVSSISSTPNFAAMAPAEARAAQNEQERLAGTAGRSANCTRRTPSARRALGVKQFGASLCAVWAGVL